MNDRKPRLILIAGPTASGKSTLAAALAEKVHGTVINADAMQVYRDMPILTAQPGALLMQRAPHLLYACVDPTEAFSAGKWLALARTYIETCWRDARVPVLVGGTGMYFQSLLKGLAAIPAIPPAIRQGLQEEFAHDGETTFRARLAEVDPAAAASIQPGYRQRLLRAMEIFGATGKTQSTWQREMPEGLLQQADISPILIMPPRATLYAACDQRFLLMLKDGALEEARGVRAHNLDPTLPAFKVIGLRAFSDHLAGKITMEEVITMAQQATRNYAKRQVTWFKNQWIANKIGFARAPYVINDFGSENCLAQVLLHCTAK